MGTMDFDAEFNIDAEEHALAEFCCQPESSIPLIEVRYPVVTLELERLV